MVSGVKWSVTDIVKIIRERQHNEFDANIAVSGDRGNGKCLTTGEEVHMADGSVKKVEDIVIGDRVISPQEDGSYTYETVKETHNHFEKDVYEVREVSRDKRILYRCSGKHTIPIYARKSKTNKEHKRIYYKGLINYKAEELSKRCVKSSHWVGFSSMAVDYENQQEPWINPYFLGVFLGDGNFNSSMTLSMGEKKRNVINKVKEIYPLFFLSDSKHKTKTARRISFSTKGLLGEWLRKNGLYNKTAGTKHIPQQCMRASINYRFNLLAGLIDTDGSAFFYKFNGRTREKAISSTSIEYTTKSDRLAEDIKNLVFSLGGNCRISKKISRCQNNFEGIYNRLRISFKNPSIIPLVCEHKKEALRGIYRHDPRHLAIECKKINPQMVYGFSITGESKWFITSNWMVTHNSTAVFKILSRFDNFNPWVHQVYDRDSVVSLLKTQYLGICWDDEAINSGYKRNFQEKGQQELIKILTAYRDNYNVFASAIPNFFSLDKDLRDLYFVHLHIIERGIAVLHMPLQGRLYSQDRWDAAYNSKVEQGWSKKMMMNPKFRPKYNKLTTFRGYLYFNDITSLQKELYKKIKKEKRKKAFKTDDEVKQDKEKSFIDNVYDLLLQGKLTKEGLVQIALTNGKKYSNLRDLLSKRLINDGQTESLMDLMKQNIVVKHRNIKQLKTLPIS